MRQFSRKYFKNGLFSKKKKIIVETNGALQKIKPKMLKDILKNYRLN